MLYKYTYSIHLLYLMSWSFVVLWHLMLEVASKCIDIYLLITILRITEV